MGCAFSLPRLPGLQKVSWNKTLHWQYRLEQEPVSHLNKLCHQSCYKQKRPKCQQLAPMSWSFLLPLLESPAAKLLTRLHRKGSGQVPGDFWAEKVQIVVPGLDSVQGWCPGPQGHLSPVIQKAVTKSRRFAIHPICWIWPWRTFFCIQKSKIGVGWPFVVPKQL